MRHIVRKHQNAASFIAHCNVSGCGASFVNFGTFRKHIQRKYQYTSEIVTCEPNFDHDMIIDNEGLVSGVTLEKAEAAFSLKLKAAHNISEGAIEEILSTVKEMTRMRMDCIRNSIETDPHLTNINELLNVDSMYVEINSKKLQKSSTRNTWV